MDLPAKSKGIRDLDRLNLRLSAETFAKIDAALANRPGVISRNTWITEAIAEKLARGATDSNLQAEANVANG